MSEVTRGEFDMLRQQVSDNQHRLELMDASGTRGVGIVQVQLTDLAKDVAGLTGRFDAHEREHADEATARVASRRWLAGTLIAALVAVEGPLAYLIAHVH